MYYTIYKITNQIDSKIYIGCHKTNDLNDDYMGSGKYLKLAQKKYGINNFTKEILFVFDNPKEMYEKEAELVNPEFLITENTYNLKIGGYGGWDYTNSNGLNNSTKTKEQLSEAALKTWEKLKGDSDYMDSLRKRQNEFFSKLHSDGKIKYDTFTGKKHTKETKQKISETKKSNKSGLGEKNSQYGTTWVWCPSMGNKKIKKEELPQYLEEGWLKTYKPGYKI
jgi:hypothetical protein